MKDYLLPYFGKFYLKPEILIFNEQRVLISLLLNNFPQINIAGILADRVANGQLFRWLTQKPILFKKHGNSFHPQNNLFRYGFDFISRLECLNFKTPPWKYSLSFCTMHSCFFCLQNNF
ncbi:hypothetical protein [Rickettsiella endosymbiont of Xylota segnis]|uniref:hypothetical protein n=1 Tax=Rickettsiella endosymbiont of Xylota segnis TaxID=3066238 RepID=UPI0030CEA44F